jgi:hypothetical protein
LYDARDYPRRGDERLSAKKRSEADDADRTAHPKTASGGGGAKRQRSGDLGRALRSVYDDTLRENVPDDFQDLLSKLS